MTVLQAALRELAGLFVDDGALALAIVAVVVVSAVLSAVFPDARSLVGAILLLGCLGILVANVMAARR